MTAWFFANLAWASVMMLVVLVLRRPVARIFGAGVAYALWLIPALRLVAPPGDWLGGLLSPLPSPPPLLLNLEFAPGAPLPPAGGPGQWVPILLAVWAGGAILFLGLQALAYRAFLKRLSLSMRSAGSYEGLPLIASAAVEGPLALGLVDRRIVVPADFERRYNAAERRLALDHEAYHHRRGDILANHVALLTLALNWFSPVAWIAFRAFRADQELSCDAAIASASPGAVADYARALVKSASRPGLIAACPLNSADHLKRRLKMLSHHQNSRLRRWSGAAVTSALIAASTMLGTPGHAQGDAQKSEPRERIERIIILDSPGGSATADQHIRRHLSPGAVARVDACQNDAAATNIDEQEGDQRVRLHICGEGDPASRAQALQETRDRFAADTNLSAETRQRLLARLDQAIARVRAEN